MRFSPLRRVSAELTTKVVVVTFTRTWVLLLGMSGLIILFWFLEGGEVLRYLVSFFMKTILLKGLICMRS